MESSVRRALTCVREYMVSFVGFGLIGLAVAYALAFGGSPVWVILETSIPVLIGCGFVWYGMRTRSDNGTDRAALVTASSLACGALFALFCAWSISLLSIRMGFSGGFTQPVISALSGGIAFGGVLGHVYVEFTHHSRENERLSHAVDASMDGIAIIVDGQFVYVNDAYASLYGVPTPDAIAGTAWTTLYTNAAQATIERDVLPSLEERNYWRGTLTGKRADGTTYPQDVTVTALEDGYVVVARDVTEQRDREQRIQVLNRVLRHNLRNAATVIQGHANLIGEQDSTLEDRHVVPIRNEIDDLIATADKARGVERTLDRNGKADLIDASKAVRSAVDRAQDIYPDARIISQTETPGSGSTTPTVDGSIVDALNELVDNAIRHNPSTASSSTLDEPTVEIATELVPYETDFRLEFTVADNGDGIPETERRAVLEGRETQLDHGSGLGLWLVNWIVQNAGGDLRFADRPSGGTVVTLSFPCERFSAPESPLKPTV